MKKNIFIYAFVLLLVSYFAIPAFSQADVIEKTGGTVISVSSIEITISEYDIENDTYVNATFIINEYTEILGVDSIDGISENDLAEIEYKIENNEKIAITIYVEKVEKEESGESGEDQL